VPAEIVVAAGANGAGKSSIAQPYIEANGYPYFNPDQHARKLVQLGVSPDEANGRAWRFGHDRLREAVDRDRSFAFETTLGGHSIAFELMRALAFGRAVTMFYVGLASPELHIRRVAARVVRGGHDIPAELIRKRYDSSRANLISFIGTKAWIRVWDNSAESADGRPDGAAQVFELREAQLVLPRTAPRHADSIPAWARPFLAQALKLALRRHSSRH